MPFTQDEMVKINQRAGFELCHGVQTEHEALNRALGYTEEAVADVSLDAIHIDRGLLRTLRNAACKHLETLPKPPRTVDVWHVEYAYRRNGGQWTPRVMLCTSEREADAVASERRGPRPEPNTFREEYAKVVITRHKRYVPS